MAEEKSFYTVYSYADNLTPGDKLKIEHTLSSRDDGTELKKWTHLSADQLLTLREASAASEQAIYQKLRGAASEWEEQAAHTMLLDNAIKYAKTEPVKHTSNQWEVGDIGFECSNMVYKMSYHVYEDTSYNHHTKKSEVVAWQVSWDLHYNTPVGMRRSERIAGQDRKRFTDKEKLDNYIIGRIAAFSDYFTEISPPIPPGKASQFKVNGLLLPGYTIEGQTPIVDKEPAKEADVGTDYSKYIRKKPHKDEKAKKLAPVR